MLRPETPPKRYIDKDADTARNVTSRGSSWRPPLPERQQKVICGVVEASCRTRPAERRASGITDHAGSATSPMSASVRTRLCEGRTADPAAGCDEFLVAAESDRRQTAAAYASWPATAAVSQRDVSRPNGRSDMSRVSTYLKFMGKTEEALNYYRSVFGTEFIGDITRMSDMPAGGDGPVLGQAEQRMVMHVELPILAGHVLMGADMLEPLGQQLRVGNNVMLNLEPDTRAETDKLDAALSEGGSEATGLQDMPWGAYWGCCLDRFGVRWMFNCYESRP